MYRESRMQEKEDVLAKKGDKGGMGPPAKNYIMGIRA